MRVVNVAWDLLPLEILRCLLMKDLGIVIKAVSGETLCPHMPHLPSYSLNLNTKSVLMLEDIFGKMESPGNEVVGPGDISSSFLETEPYLNLSSLGRVPDPTFLIQGVL